MEHFASCMAHASAVASVACAAAFAVARPVLGLALAAVHAARSAAASLAWAFAPLLSGAGTAAAPLLALAPGGLKASPDRFAHLARGGSAMPCVPCLAIPACDLAGLRAGAVSAGASFGSRLKWLSGFCALCDEGLAQTERA